MELGKLNKFQKKIYLNEMRERQLGLSSELDDYVQSVAKDFLVDKFFLKGQRLEWNVDKNGDFDEGVCSLILSYAIDINTSERGSMYIKNFD